MNGDHRLYVLARRTLLDALEALGPHAESVILVGAQAVYVHAGGADIAVAPFTTDGDVAINPLTATDDPRLTEAMQAKHFVLHQEQIGTWIAIHDFDGQEIGIAIDLLVPESLGGPGRRGARLGAHGKRAARKVRGLEAAFVDNTLRPLGSLEPSVDPRVLEVKVAGPGALIVAKVIKIAERLDDSGRRKDKDALDVLRLLRVVSTEELAASLIKLVDDVLSKAVAQEALQQLDALFGSRRGEGVAMAVRATTPLEPADAIAESCLALTADVLSRFRVSKP